MQSKTIAIVIFFMWWQLGFAQQSKFYQNQELLNFTIAKKELSHIAVENDRITGLKMSNDLLEVEQNEKSGEVFVRPKADSCSPITLFITTEQGRTIALKLTPKDIPAARILVKFKEELTTINELNEPAANREQQIIKILKLLDAGKEVEYLKPPKLTNKLKVTSAIRHKGQFIGQKLIVKNPTKIEVSLKEEEFNSPKVLAVALSKLKVAPNETVELYLVKERD